MYKIESDTWSRAPDMMQARADFSFCVLGETLYAMLGIANGTLINTIESLNARKLINGDQASWCAFNLTSGQITPRRLSLVAPIDRNEIAILGGNSEDGNLGDVIVLNTQTKTAQTVV